MEYLYTHMSYFSRDVVRMRQFFLFVLPFLKKLRVATRLSAPLQIPERRRKLRDFSELVGRLKSPVSTDI